MTLRRESPRRRNAATATTISRHERARLLARITTDPEQHHGEPCIRGMRFSINGILRALAGGESPEEIVYLFPFLTLDDVRAAQVYADEHKRHR